MRTGITEPGGEVVLMMTRAAARDELAVAACFADAAGVVSGCRTAADDKHQAYPKGFQAIHARTTVRGRGELPIFGFFVGPAVVVQATIGGRPEAARTSTWDLDSDITTVWFPMDSIPSHDPPEPLRAFGFGGVRLPAGKTRIPVAHG